MNVATQSKDNVSLWRRLSRHVSAGGIIVGHTLQHLYAQGFYVVLPVIYTSLGLSPVATGFIGTVRQVSSGATSMLGGFMIDRLQNWRALTLYLSLIVMGLGYLLVGMAPTYALIVLSGGLAGAAGSLWHPAAISLLSQQYPERRGLMMGLHRSTGNLGDMAGPLIVGALLVVMAWQKVLFGAFPVALIFAFLLWTVVRGGNAAQAKTVKPSDKSTTGQQLGAIKNLLKSKELILLLLVSGISGLGQGSLMLWLPMYLQETQHLGSLAIGFHVGLLSSVGIASGPLLGILSDRLGRKKVIFIVLMAKAIIATSMAIVGGGLGLTILIGLMGAFMFALNPLVQAGALDIAEGKRLEGSMIGLLWGNNALFGGVSPTLVGFLVSSVGYGVLFWYVAGMSSIAGIFALFLLFTKREGQTTAS